MAEKPTTVKEYLATLSPQERATIEAVRRTILDNLDKGYEEGVQYGMIGYYVPHSVYPPGYHCDPRQPLPFAGIAARKGSTSLYLGCVYGDDGERERFQEEWKATGKKLDMGVSCIRFKKLDDIPLDVVGRAVKRITVKKYVASYEAARAAMAARPVKGKPGATKTAKKAAKGTAKKTSKK
jgi:hypothetical protein